MLESSPWGDRAWHVANGVLLFVVAAQAIVCGARFLRRRIIRKKYVHVSDPDRAPILAALPEKLLERGVAGPHPADDGIEALQILQGPPVR